MADGQTPPQNTPEVSDRMKDAIARVRPQRIAKLVGNITNPDADAVAVSMARQNLNRMGLTDDEKNDLNLSNEDYQTIFGEESKSPAPLKLEPEQRVDVKPEKPGDEGDVVKAILDGAEPLEDDVEGDVVAEIINNGVPLVGEEPIAFDAETLLNEAIAAQDEQAIINALTNIEVDAKTLAIFHATGDDADRTALEESDFIVSDGEGNKVFNTKILADLAEISNSEGHDSPLAKAEFIEEELKRQINSELGSSAKLANAGQDARKMVVEGKPIDPARAVPDVLTSDELQELVLGEATFDLQPKAQPDVEKPIIKIGANDTEVEPTARTQPTSGMTGLAALKAAVKAREESETQGPPAPNTPEAVELEKARIKSITDGAENTSAALKALREEGILPTPEDTPEEENDEPEASTATPLSLSASGDSGDNPKPKPIDTKDYGDERLTDFLNALRQAYQIDDFPPQFEKAIQNGSAQWLADVLDIEPGSTIGNVKFVDNVQGHHILVTPDKIEHIDNDGNFSFEEAIQFITLASANPKMMKEGITINGGTQEQQAMLVVAAKLLEHSGQTVPKINNINDIPENVVEQVGNGVTQQYGAAGLLSRENGFEFDKFERNVSPEDSQPTEPEADNTGKADEGTDGESAEDTEEADASDKPDVGDVTAEEKPEGPKEDEEPDDTATDFGTEVKEGTVSPSADDVQKEFAAKSNLTEEIYDQVVEHVREVGKPTQAEIKKALGNAGLEHGIHDAYKDAVDHMIANNVIIEHTVGNSPVPQRKLVEPS